MTHHTHRQGRPFTRVLTKTERHQVERARKVLRACKAGEHPHDAATETYQRHPDE